MALRPLNAAEINLGKLFTNDFDFVIPEYQRPYAWGQEETLQLLSDLEGALARDTDEPYFLGSIVLVKESGQSTAEVIDGQQRLTTLTILLAVLRDLVQDEELKRDIHGFIEERAVRYAGTPARPRLTLRPRDREFFNARIQAKGAVSSLVALSDNSTSTDAQRAIRDNARALHEELSCWSEERLQALFTMLAMRTFLVTVSTPDLNSAYRIFSVMNARGLPLSPPDIFKSQVVGAIPEEERQLYADKWERIEEELGREEFGDLFLYIRTIKSQTRAVRGLLQEFPEQVLNDYVLHDNGKGFIKQILEPYAQADQTLLSQDLIGDEAWRRANAWMKRLSELDNDDWRPLALWALKEHGDDASFLNDFFRKLERLAASMLIRRVYRTPRLQRYIDVLKQLASGDGLNATAFDLTDEEKRETRHRLDGDIYLINPVRRYVLLRLDSILADDPGASYDHSTITVEHVLPQTPRSSSQWSRDFTEAERDEWTHRLGNLLLLNRKKNSQAGNLDFTAKKDQYFSTRQGVSVFALTTQVLQEDEWTPATLTRRHEQLLQRLFAEWSLV